MVRASHRPAPWQRALVFGAGAVLLLTGIAWLALHYGRSADALPSPWEPWSMRLHGLAAFAALFVLGALAAAHIPHGWRASHRLRWARQRASGIALCALAGALVLTGYLLYYFAPDPVRPALGWLHSGLGLTAAVAVAAHRHRSGRRAAR
jgi:hypothetical protein